MMTKLIFVYNADHGRIHAIMDSIHKIVSPSTYSCRLCAITHTPIGMKREWRRFVESLDVEVEFLHRDEFTAKHPERRLPLPCVLRVCTSDRWYQVLISADEMNVIHDLCTLRGTIERRLSEVNSEKSD